MLWYSDDIISHLGITIWSFFIIAYGNFDFEHGTMEDFKKMVLKV